MNVNSMLLKSNTWEDGIEPKPIYEVLDGVIIHQ